MGEFKNGFFPIAVGEMWFLGHKWKPSLGFCLSVGAEGTGRGSGLAVPSAPPAQSSGHSCCLCWELGQCLCPALPGMPQQPLQPLLCSSRTHRAPVKGRRGRPRNQLQFVLRIFCNRTRAEPEPLVITENTCELCFLNSELGLEVSMWFCVVSNNYCCIWTATLSKHYLSLIVTSL